MSNNPKITVVTVCYNAVDTIEKTILSVVNQTYSNLEYIVIDGNSSDGTVNIIKKYANIISKWISEPDTGIYDAMNKGIDLATGEWINFMNAGDFFVNNHVIENLLPVFEEKHDVIYGNTILTNGKHQKMRKAYISEDTMPSFCHQSAFISSQVMKRYHYDKNLVIAGDAEFFYKLHKKGYDFYYVDMSVSLNNFDGISSNNRAMAYIESSKVKGEKVSKLRLIKYRLEDAMPIWLMRKVLSLKWRFEEL